MSRLWDKGLPLDQRVLNYTAGEDHALDNRLIAYDAQASIAHAQMLNAQGLLSSEDLQAIREGLTQIAAEHARGEWRVTLEHEDGQTALET
jgi:argininosuccinate lyase